MGESVMDKLEHNGMLKVIHNISPAVEGIYEESLEQTAKRLSALSAEKAAAAQASLGTIPVPATAMRASTPAAKAVSTTGPAMNIINELGGAGGIARKIAPGVKSIIPTIEATQAGSRFLGATEKDDYLGMLEGMLDVAAAGASASGIGMIYSNAYHDLKSIIQKKKKAQDEWGLDVDDADGHNALRMSPSSIKNIRANGAEGTGGPEADYMRTGIDYLPDFAIPGLE